LITDKIRPLKNGLNKKQNNYIRRWSYFSQQAPRSPMKVPTSPNPFNSGKRTKPAKQKTPLFFGRGASKKSRIF
jgi:hypothetical protein